MNEFSTEQKYVDLYGLGLFWHRAKNYITNKLLGLDGNTIPLNRSNSDSLTIAEELDRIWEALGGDVTLPGGGSVSENVSNIYRIKIFYNSFGSFRFIRSNFF